MCYLVISSCKHMKPEKRTVRASIKKLAAGSWILAGKASINVIVSGNQRLLPAASR